MHIENVLSVFDGHSGLLISLEQAGFTVGTYFSSEIDAHAIKASKACYPDAVRLGDVRNVNGLALPKIGLFGGGSPCQSFSFAGKRKGMSTKCEIEILTIEHYLKLKSENFEFEGFSYLFWEYIRILCELRQVNPNVYFFLENVEMGAKWEKVISKAIGVNGIHVNSTLLSAQNRKRIYWTNIGMEPVGLFGDLESKIQQPKNRGIYLKDILEPVVDEKYFLSDKAVQGIVAHKAVQKEKGFGFGAVIKESHQKMNALKCGGKGVDDLVRTESVCLKEVRSTEAKAIRKENRAQGFDSNPYRAKDIELRSDGKTYCLDTGKTNAIEIISGTLRTHNDGKGFRKIDNGKGACVPARGREDGSGQNVVSINSRIRRLTPRECGRLQTVPEHIIDKILNSGVSESQIYKMFGNGWTIEAIVHFLKYMKFS